MAYIEGNTLVGWFFFKCEYKTNASKFYNNTVIYEYEGLQAMTVLQTCTSRLSVQESFFAHK